MIGQRVLARIPDLAAPKSVAAAPALSPIAGSAPAASPAAPKVAPTLIRHKPAWDPSLLRVPRLSPRGKLILGACVLVAVVWFVRGRLDGQSAPAPNSPPIDIPMTLTVVPLEETPLVQPPGVAPSAKESVMIAAPQNTPPPGDSFRQADVSRYDSAPKAQPTTHGPATSAIATQRQSVAPPSTQPVPPWQEPAAAPTQAIRQELRAPINSPAAADRTRVTPPKMSPLWPQEDRRPQPATPPTPQLQHNQFVIPQPAVRRPVDAADSQIEWAAPYAPGREAGRETPRTSDRRGESAPGRYDGSF